MTGVLLPPLLKQLYYNLKNMSVYNMAAGCDWGVGGRERFILAHCECDSH